MSTVMWDYDGVASLWVENFYPWLCVKEGWEYVPGAWRIWHHYRNHEMTDEQFVARLREYAEVGGFAEQIPVPGFSETVQRLHAAGHTQHVVTDRPDAAQADTLWWTDTYAPEIDTVEFSRDKTVFKQQGPPTYYAIDDRVENVESLRKAGVFAYLLTWPWNADSDLPRVNSLSEFADKVLRGANS